MKNNRIDPSAELWQLLIADYFLGHKNLVEAYKLRNSTYQTKTPNLGSTKRIFKHKVTCDVWLYDKFFPC